jgi:hypothetical protein
MIELDKQGYKHCNRSCWFKRHHLQQETFKQQLKWMEIGKGEDFVTNSIQDAINSSITTLKTKFWKQRSANSSYTIHKAWWNYRFAHFRSAENTQVWTLCIVAANVRLWKPFSIILNNTYL